jgi:hypothetical protein
MSVATATGYAAAASGTIRATASANRRSRLATTNSPGRNSEGHRNR